MNIAIVSNITNGIGLEVEYKLLRAFLERLGHQVTGYQYDEALPEGIPVPSYDIAFFMEVVPRNLLCLSERRFMFPNPEWLKPDMIEIVDRSFEKIFAKTREGERVLESLFPGRVHYTGFMCTDKYDPRVPRTPTFLHLAGNSMLRGTQEVLDAWRWRKNGKWLDAHLVVVGTAKFSREGLEDSDRVLFSDRIPADELKTLQNMCMFHLLPSGTEGFGFALHEALSVGAYIITIGKPPMVEIDRAFFLPGEKAGKYNLADIWRTSALDIFEAVEKIQYLSEELIGSDKIRQKFLEDNDFFATTLANHLSDPVKKIERSHTRTDGKKTIAFIGNFSAPESTENMVKWALEERLSYKVETLQENEIGIANLRDAMEWNDILLWIRTPGWLPVGDKEMQTFLEDLERKEIPTISMHLDKFVGIQEREKLIGQQPFWRTRYVWTADGSPAAAAIFNALKINHNWMRPAVSEVYCHPGTPRDHFRCDVGFVGARDYHAEYPFRRQLVEWLEATYGEGFKHITNVRGHELNDFYASCKVVVGDCIFAGTPNYWSDRVPETCGRGGFLLHPQVRGMTTPLAFYEAQNLENLHWQIEYWLDHEAERKEVRHRCSFYTWSNDTWTSRMRQILEEVL